VDGRARIRAALDHREADRIPFDLGGTRMTGIHVGAYPGLRAALGLPARPPRVGDLTQQLADVDTDVLDALGADVRGISPGSASSYRREIVEDGEHRSFVDEWGVLRRMPLDGGLYYDPARPPLGGDIDDAAVEAFPWPDGADHNRFAGLVEAAQAARG
jgi:uroporphyrinogen decarboxylase